MDAECSLTIWKYDFTNARKDGVWDDDSFISTGWREPYVEEVLGEAVRVGDANGEIDNPLGNGQNSNGYAQKGIEFTILRVANFVTYSEPANDAHPEYELIELLYGFDSVEAADLLAAIGLADGAGRAEYADSLNNQLMPVSEEAAAIESTIYYYASDTLNKALYDSLSANATAVKDALEAYVKANGGTAMPLTDAYGKTSTENLELGLYVCVETKVPEMVVSSCNPFLLSLPMTNVSGGNSEDGGTYWIYDVTTFPKNLTGIPTLEKLLKESAADTGKNQGTKELTDGYAHTGTASDGDIIDYLITSTLPSISSASTYISEYSFIDTLSKGISYLKNDVVLSFYTDAACKNLITTWTEADGKFAVSYNTTTAGESVMTISMTEKGLAEINTSKDVYSGANMVNSGYSDCTVKITYQAQMNSDASVIYGDAGNPNEVALVWRRTSSNYYDTLVDDAHVFTYGIELTKLFSDGQGNFDKVEFILFNETDGYYAIAELNEDEGIYYITGHTGNPENATRFIPIKGEDGKGKVFVKGVEDDSWVATELRTDDGYTLLKDDIKIVISQVETADTCDIYTSDVLGLVQNDPRYATIINDTGDLRNMPQKHLEHHHLTASSTVDGNNVTMLEDDGSKNAHAPLSVVNTKGFDLPATGDHGVWMYGLAGILLMAGSITSIIIGCRKKSNNNKK